MNYDIKYVALYLRKSRGEEDDLIKHETILKEICVKNSWKYVIYKEIGTSDSIELRPEFQRLLRDIEDNVYDAILVVDYDRLSRGDATQQDTINKILKKSNTLIITPNKVYDLNNEMDSTYTEFQGFMARQEYKQITKRLRQGKKIGAKLGNWTNGKPPFPYEYERWKDKYKEKGLVVNDDKLVIYRFIIDNALNDIPPYKIAWELNKQNIPSPNGKKWTNITVYRLLKDETHLGKIISNKQKGDGHKIKRKDVEDYIKLDRSEWVIVENCHEAVKTQFEHDKIIDMLNRRNKTPRKARAGIYGLSGLVKCGICGYNLTFQKKDTGNLLIKKCWYIDEYGNKCTNSGGSYNLLEVEIKKAIINYKNELLKQKNSNIDENIEVQNMKVLLNQYEKNLNKYIAALNKVNDTYDLGDYSRNEWLQRKNKWENEIQKVRVEIDDLKIQLSRKQTVSNEQRLFLLNYFIDNIDKIEDENSKNKLYKSILDYVTWTRKGDDLDIKVNFR